MYRFHKADSWRPGEIRNFLLALTAWVIILICSVAGAAERTMPAGTTAHTEIIEVGDSEPVIVPSIWNVATVMVRQIDGGNSSFRAAIGTSTVDVRLPLIKNINASFRSSGFVALQSETGTATLVIYRVSQAERALALNEGELTVTLPSTEVAAELATDSIGLIDAVNAVAAACASETNLVAAIDAITTALAGVIAVDAEISTDSIGLVAAINSTTAEVAQPTEVQEQIISLSANTAANITSEIVGRRNDIMIRAQDPDKQFWISTETDAVIGAAIPVRDWVRLRLPKTVVISVISSEALDLSAFESGW